MKRRDQGRVEVAQDTSGVIRRRVEAGHVPAIDIVAVQTQDQEDRRIAREIMIDAIGTGTMTVGSHHITTRVVEMEDVAADPGVEELCGPA